MAPLAPHLAAEAYEVRHGRHVHEEAWPTYDEAATAEERVTMIVQVDGKVRDRLEVDSAVTEEEAIAIAIGLPRIAELFTATPPLRIVARPPRLVNFVSR